MSFDCRSACELQLAQMGREHARAILVLAVVAESQTKSATIVALPTKKDFVDFPKFLA